MAEIPKIVGQRLQAIAKPGDHPDPNLLCAFVERALAKSERVQVLEHLSRCTSCREIVSATQPGIADPVPVAPVNPSWFSWPVLRWGAVVACIVVVGAAVTLRQRQEARQIAATIAEGKSAPETRLPVQNSGIEKKAAALPVPNSEVKSVLAKKQTEQSGRRFSNSVATQLALTGPVSAPPLPTGSPLSTAPGTMFAKAANRQKAITGASALSSPVEMADARRASPFAEVVPGRAKAASPEWQDAKTDKATGSGSLSTKSETAEVSGAAVSVASDALVPANLAPRWTLGSDGTLQRSLDSGRTWQTIPVSSKTIFRALAANGLDIWVGGAAGALFHSFDAGQHWTHVRPVANGEALDDDIIGVEFTDTLHGKLTTSMEETWITSDAGQTWQKQ